MREYQYMKNLKVVSVLLAITLTIGIIATIYFSLNRESYFVVTHFSAIILFYSYLAYVAIFLIGIGLYLIGKVRNDKTIKILATVYLGLSLLDAICFILSKSRSNLLFNIGYLGSKITYILLLILFITIIVKLIKRKYLSIGLGTLLVVSTILAFFGINIGLYLNFIFVYFFYKNSKEPAHNIIGFEESKIE
jgi:hypothetical protein